MKRKNEPAPESILHRAATIAIRATGQGTDDRRAEIAFSSEIEAQRWFGGEILDHKPNSVRMDFMKSGRAPLLMYHDGRQVVGVVESASIDTDKVGRAVVRFGNSPTASAALQDVRDGILSNVSVGYRVHNMVLDSAGDDGETYRVDDWEPLEVSLVSIPVDPTVGVGRSDAIDQLVTRARNTHPTSTETTMDPKKEKGEESPKEQPTEVKIDLAGETRKAAEAERARAKEIRDIGSRHNAGTLAQEHIDKGTSVELFRGIMLNELGERGSSKPLHEMPGDVKLTEKEKKRYSLSRAILAQADSLITKRPVAASFERDLSEEIAKRAAKESRGLFVPYAVMHDRSEDVDQQSLFTRTLTASGGVASGGAVVQSTVYAGQYVPVNYNIPVVVQAGARVLPGLTGNVLIPKMTAGKSGTWVTPENTAVSSADPTFAQISMTPKDYGTVCDISRRLLLQANPAVDGLVRDDMAMAIKLGIDSGALIGTGASGQPLGVTGQSGVATVAGGTNGAALTWANTTYLPQKVAEGNRLGMGPCGFITNGQAFFHATRTPKVANYPTFIAQYDEGNGGAQIGANAGSILGMPVHVSQQVPSNLVKGSSGAICSAMYFGVWSDLLIGEWGVLDLLVDPYTFSNTGAIRIRAFVTVDVAVRYGASFSQIIDIITT